MTSIKLLLLFMLFSTAALSQVDSTLQIDMSTNINKCNCSKPFSELVKEYCQTANLDSLTKTINQLTIEEGFNMSFTPFDVYLFGTGHTIPPYSLQIRITNWILEEMKNDE